MKDYIFRFLIVGIMAACITLLFLGGIKANAEGVSKNIKLGMEWDWPVEGTISDTYGTRMGRHKGIDIAGSLGSPVKAVFDGEIIKSYLSSTYGNAILIEHPNGFVTVYAHLDQRQAEEGDQVKKGEQIGTMGNTGVSTGVHLHFEIHQSEWTFEKENAINPVHLLGSIKEGDFISTGENSILHTEAFEAMDTGIEVSINSAKTVHIVKKGDTLWEIAMNNGLGVEELQEMNGLDGITIFPGQELSLEKTEREPIPKGSAAIN
ncbi:peptidoglycan DD-metalloendopeptidase family protein [Bacillus sp. FJAT-27445]|uniref:peptidoglycan DD-metalloendopeptidase family protein n=1 Tax=Bacillus sp. FJAT-27445 TaxID=1679166 RepID=UPI000743DF56|nr:peptidoglycan DD-metalloendopeptidase family protein [Bacillus sp. FJAT-27445]